MQSYYIRPNGETGELHVLTLPDYESNCLEYQKIII